MSKLATSLTDRLTQMARAARKRAEATPPGPKRKAFVRAAVLSENALRVQQWLSSPGLRRPT
jgi:hypothetical protein